VRVKVAYNNIVLLKLKSQEAAGGHYTCDVRIDTKWTRFDDEKVQMISSHDVLHPPPHYDAYIFFYQRINTSK
jgi:ubiquitin C-terminal hydrolase